jgi:hypothetical protein
LLAQVGYDRALVPDVISARQKIDLGSQKLVGDFRSYAKAGGGVLNVGHTKIYAKLLYETVQLLLDYPAAGFSENIANKKNAHRSR